MTRRVLALAGYFFGSLLWSLYGWLFILLALACWQVLFDPQQWTPHVDYYILMLSMLGALFTFLVTLTISARAGQAMHYPWLARLSNRAEYLMAVLASSFGFGLCLQLLVAVLATCHGPAFTLGAVIQMPLVWLPINGLAAVLALHATDMCSVGWSRVYLFGALTVCYLGRRLNVIGPALAVVFWPFTTMADAVRSGACTPAGALASRQWRCTPACCGSSSWINSRPKTWH